MKIIFLSLIIILTTNTYANTLTCKQVAVVYAETGGMYVYSKQEQKEYPLLRIKVSSNTVWLDMPSGRKSKFNLKDIRNGERRYFSQENAYLRKPKVSPRVFCESNSYCNLWYFDLNVNGKLQSTVLNCD